MRFSAIGTLAIIIGLLFTSCRKDEIIDESGNPNPIDIEIETFYETHLSGIILDEDNLGIENVQIFVDGRNITTDINGVFLQRHLELSNKGSLVKIEKEGYFDAYQFAKGQLGVNSYLQSRLVNRQGFTLNTNSKDSIELNGGAAIVFPANSVIHSDGSMYSGSFNVFAHWYDPTDPFTASSMPGDLRAVNSENEKVQLSSYGMMAVELEDKNGQELQLAKDVKAILKFPIPPSISLNNGDVIPMWHFDEEEGYWVEEGDALVSQSILMTEVSHFSFWNCDIDFEFVKIEGRLLIPTGDTLSNKELVFRSVDQSLAGRAIVDQKGYFSTFIPKDLELTLFIKDCNQEFDIAKIPEQDQDLNLMDIVVDVLSVSKIIAHLVNCENEALSSAYALIYSESGVQLTTPDLNGEISFLLSDCMDQDFEFIAFDSETLLRSDVYTLDVNEDLIDLDTVVICDDLGKLNCEVSLLCCPTSGFTIFVTDGVAPFEITVVDQNNVIVHNDIYPNAIIDVFLDVEMTYNVIIEDNNNEICMFSKELPKYLNELSGKAWLDVTGGTPHILDNLDEPYEDLKVFLLDELGFVLDSTITNLEGTYSFNNFEGGKYAIQIDDPNIQFVNQGSIGQDNESHIDPVTASSFYLDIGSWDFDNNYFLNVGIQQ